MSTKTVTKRVALATVVALGAGVLSLVSVTSAHATANAAAGTTGPAAVDSVLNIGTAANTTGAAVLSTNSYPLAANNASFGLLAASDIAGNAAGITGTTETAVLTSSGSLVVYSGRDTANQSTIYTVTGGTISAAQTTATATIVYNNTLTAVAISSSLAQAANAVSIKPNAGVTSMIVNMYTSTAAATSTLANNPGNYTLAGTVNVSVSATATSGTVSQSKSGVYYANTTGGVTSDATTPISGQPAIGTSAWNVPQYGSIVLKDAYGVVVPAGILQVAATNGAYVAVSSTATSPSAAGTTPSSNFVTTSGTTNAAFTVGAATSAASTTVVTISYNGVVIGTKSFTFTGEVAKVILSGPANGLISNNGTAAAGAQNAVSIAFKDSAGNTLYVGGTASYPTSVTKDAGTAGTGITLNGTAQYPVNASTSGYVAFGCGGVSATGNLVVDYSNVDGSVIVSNGVPVTCSNVPATYTAKFDKSTYQPGDIATLSVTFKDSTGALSADVATGTGAIASSTKTPSISGSNLTSVTTATAGLSTDATTNGVVTYKFIVGQTAGTYSAAIDFPNVDVAGVQSSITASYTVASSGTSLNDVLKGIVSLIASINKQIAALAKLVTKK